MKILKKALTLTMIFVVMLTMTAFAATTMYVNGDNVRVRSTPTTSSKSNIVGSANSGDECKVISEEGDWTKVCVKEVEGYIRNDFLQTKKIESSKSSKSTKTSKSKTNNNSVNVVDTSSQSGVEMVWIPTNGGKKIHSKSTCSGMENPAYVTIDEANKRGFYDYCKKCH